MFRWFLLWRERRRVGRSSYKLDRRNYRGLFNANFFANLDHGHFWDHHRDPSLRRQRRKLRLGWLIALGAAALAAWFVVESFRGLVIYR